MNNERRKKIGLVKKLIQDANRLVDEIKDEEQDYFDNMPENLQGSDRGCAAEDAIDSLDAAMEALDEALSNLEDAAM